MKLISMLLATLLTSTAIPSINIAAETAQDIGPETIKLRMGGLYLPFSHWKHQKLADNKCFDCHKPQEWKIKKWDKEIAHQICISCHDLYKKGPVECNDCHNSAYTSMQKYLP